MFDRSPAVPFVYDNLESKKFDVKKLRLKISKECTIVINLTPSDARYKLLTFIQSSFTLK